MVSASDFKRNPTASTCSSAWLSDGLSLQEMIKKNNEIDIIMDLNENITVPFLIGINLTLRGKMCKKIKLDRLEDRVRALNEEDLETQNLEIIQEEDQFQS